MADKCCEHCDDGEGNCVFPYYGVAPHRHNESGSIIGSTVISNEAVWPDNFTEDTECPGLGTYTHCIECGRG